MRKNWVARAACLILLASGATAVEGRRQPGSAPSSSCRSAGCLRSAIKIGDYPAAELRPFLSAGVSIDNGYSVWAIEYVTGERTSLATVTVPFGVKPPANGWPIVANNHGTIG